MISPPVFIQRMQFFWQLLLILVITGLLPLLLFGVWQQQKLEQTIVAERTQQLALLANEKKMQMQIKMESQLNNVQHIAMVPSVSYVLKVTGNDLVRDQLDQQMLENITTLATNFIKLNQQDRWLLVNLNGKVVFSLDDGFELGEDLSADIWQKTPLGEVFSLVQQKKKAVTNGYEWYEGDAALVAFVAAPVLDTHGNSYGYVIVEMNKFWLESLSQARQGLGETGEIMLGWLRPDGQSDPLTYPRFVANAQLQRTLLKGEPVPLERAVAGENGIGQSIDYRGSTVLSAWLFDEQLKIGLVIKQDMSELMSPLEQARRVFLQSFFLIMIAMMGITWLLSRRMSVSIAHIAQRVSFLGKGFEFEPITSEHITSRELAILVDGINKTAVQIETHIDLLTVQAAQLEEQAADLENAKQHLEEQVANRTATLKEYIALVDEEVIVSRTDLEGAIQYVSKAFCRISGYSSEELMGENHRIVKHPDMPSEVYQDLWSTITQGKTWQGEILNRHKSGSFYWVSASISPTYDQYSGKPTGYMAVRQDITDKKRIELLAVVDEMTGLYNRRYFNDQVDKLWRMAGRHQQLLAFIMIDVDYFKRYNDSQGHFAGDEALKAVANVLKLSVRRSTELAFRLGGEEMAILSLVDHIEDAQLLAEQIRQGVIDCRIAHPENDAAEMLTVSIGVCYFDGRNCQGAITPLPDRLYQLADGALYQAKEDGRNRVVMCQQGLDVTETI